MNEAQKLLARIGGTASLVAGVDGHWWADQQMAKKTRANGKVGGGHYGRDLMAHFDRERQSQKA